MFSSVSLEFPVPFHKPTWPPFQWLLQDVGGIGFLPPPALSRIRVGADTAQFLSVLRRKEAFRLEGKEKEEKGTVLRRLLLSTYMKISSIKQTMTQLTSKMFYQHYRTSWKAPVTSVNFWRLLLKAGSLPL